MNVGIIGAGLIGNKRAQALSEFRGDHIVSVVDIDIDKAKALADIIGCGYSTNPGSVLKNPKIDAVIVSTINKYLAQYSLAALESGKHVLCEKPLGVSVPQVKKCIVLAEREHLIYKAGYNHRFHPAIYKAHKMVKSGKIGRLMFIKASYGHGARPGYENEWRCKKELSGGGELLDQGCHIIDLLHWFTGKRSVKVCSVLSTKFWPIQPLEDNAFVILQLGYITASFHTSWTQWKNEFIFEIYGQKGYIKINGLGGSYGTETLVFSRGAPGKKPNERIVEFEGPDKSWIEEWKNFRLAIKKPEKLLSSGRESLDVLKIIEKIYRDV